MTETTATATMIFPIGCLVSLKNLVRRADLNGRKGEVIGKPHSKNGRIPVKLDNMEKPIVVKATNLQVVETSNDNGFSLFKTARGVEYFAQLLREEGKYDEAIQYYQQALDVDEDCTTAHLGIGLSHLLARRWTEAEQSLKTCIDKKNCVDKCGAILAAHAYFNLSLCLEKRLDNISKILPDLDDNNPRPLDAAGRDVALTLRQLCQDILKYRQIACAMDPHNAIYKNGLEEWEEKIAYMFAPGSDY